MGGPVEVDVKLYSPYYTCKDHDALLFTTYDKTSEVTPLDVEDDPVVLERNHLLPGRKRKPMQERQTWFCIRKQAFLFVFVFDQ